MKKNIIIALVLLMAITTGAQVLQAQERGATQPPSIKISENPQFQNRMNNAPPDRQQAGKPDAPKTASVALDKNEKEHIIKGYRVDYKANPMATADNVIATLLLFNAQDEKIGIVNFYAAGAKALTQKETISDKGVVTMAYPIELMDKVTEFVARNPQTVIIYNTESKTAYLTMAVMPTRHR